MFVFCIVCNLCKIWSSEKPCNWYIGWLGCFLGGCVLYRIFKETCLIYVRIYVYMSCCFTCNFVKFACSPKANFYVIIDNKDSVWWILYSEVTLCSWWGCKPSINQSINQAVGSVVRALRSKGRGFDSRQEHKKNLRVFLSQKGADSLSVCPTPVCIYMHAYERPCTHVKDHVVHVRIQWIMETRK